MALNMMLYFLTFLRNSIYGKIFELNAQNVAKVVLETPCSIVQHSRVPKACGCVSVRVCGCAEDLGHGYDA